jgi:hypothetical protein
MDDTTDKHYEVGFGKPPQGTQFRKGRSGNPKGRPKGKPNLATVIRRALDAKVMIDENGQQRVVTKLEACIIQLINKARTGDPRSCYLVTQLARASEDSEQQVSKERRFEEADRRVLEGILERFAGTDKQEEKEER